MLPHLRELLKHAVVVPHVNQFELHPALPQRELVEFCKTLGIQVVAYASLGVGELLGDEAVAAVAARRQRTPAQVLLRWGLQQGACVIPKASSAARIQANSRVFDFELDAQDLVELAALSQGGCERRFCWNPETVT